MGKAWMMRRGGSGGMNFNVYAGLDEPAVLMENTIWINTDIDMPQWSIAAKNPYLAREDEDLMDGVQTAEGYLNASGGVNSPDAEKKEVYTADYISAEYGVTYNYEYGMSAKYSQWLVISEYTSDLAFIARTVLVNSVTGVLATGTYTPSKSTVAYVRLAWRTYGDTGTAVSLIRPNAEHTPGSVPYGTVWIQSSSSGSVSLNALKENGLYIELADAKSLIGLDPFDAKRRTWKDIPAYAYQNGEWVEIKVTTLALYSMGDTCSGVTGGWTKSGGTLTFNTDHMKFVASGAAMHTVNRIDLTDYSTLRFSALSSSEQSTTTVGVGAGTAANDFAASVALPKGTTAYRDFDVDVSDLTGEYYIKVQTTASSVGCCVQAVTLLG